MYEVELKVRAEHGPVRTRLEALGATRLGAVTQTDVYYDHPARSFAETDEALRVRAEDPADGERTVVLTYKGPLVEAASKTRRELETRIGDLETTDEILRALGFEPAAEVEKDRERYGLEGFTVTLDRVDGLGTFVEVDRAVDEDDIEGVREHARAVMRRLGLDPDDQIRTSYLGLLLEARTDAGNTYE